MEKFVIEICRTSYAFETFEVKAKDEKEAREKAMQMAYDTVFSESDAEYSVESVETHKED